MFGIVCAGGIKGRKKFFLLLAIVIMVTMLSVSCGSGSGGVGGENPDPNPNPSANEIEQKVIGLQGGTTYYWKVTVDDGSGGSIESEVRSFTTL